MIDLNQEIPNENLTQRDIMQFLLHSTQHVATREELQDTKKELKQEIGQLDKKIGQVESSLKQEISEVESSLKQEIGEVKQELKQDISEVKQDIKYLDAKIDKVNFKFDKLQWLIIATMMTVLFKDYILTLFHIVK